MQVRRVLSPAITVLFVLAAVITVSLPAVAQAAAATVPRLITFSGTLATATAADGNGVVVAPGTAPTKVVAITFSLYSDETGGAPLWSEVQNVQVDGDGHYTVQLGASKPDGLPMDIFASVQAHWLGVQPQGCEEQPRVLLVSVPYALKSADAETFGGLPPSSYVQVPSAATNQSTTATSSGNGSQSSSTGSGKPPVVTLVYGNGTPGYIPLWNSFTSQTSSVMYQNPSTKYIGIGTLAPIASLNVANSDPAGTAFAGINTANGSPAIFGLNQATSGQAIAVKAQSLSTTGIAVAGRASAVTGKNTGVAGESDSSSGIGVLGEATATGGSTFGVVGQTSSSIGVGIEGQTFSPTGASYGVIGAANGPDAFGMFGYNQATTGQATGIEGQSNSADGIGVWGVAIGTTGKATGMLGNTDSPTGYGVFGQNNATSGLAIGVAGSTPSSDQNATGVYGQATSSTGPTNGLWGQTNSSDGNADGVYGLASSNSGGANGVEGISYAPNGYGVWGQNKSGSPGGHGVVGSSTGGVGVLGLAGYGNIDCCTNALFGQNVATSGHNNGGELTTSSAGGVGGIFENTGGGLSILARVNANQNSFAVDGGGNGWFNGNLTVQGGGSSTFSGNLTVQGTGSTLGGGVQINGNLNVTGTLTKGGGSFKIDDPLDPANKYLSHSFVESPDMMNIYNGVVRLDARGQAWVVLPEYFEALNRDFRYQLTSMGSAQPRLYIAREVTGNRFKISGGRANGKVSWQVTGIRHDAWANAHRIPNEEDKPAEARGTYLYPEAHVYSATKKPAAIGNSKH